METILKKKIEEFQKKLENPNNLPTLLIAEKVYNYYLYEGKDIAEYRKLSFLDRNLI
jgi:hypothetical protein